MPAAVTNQEMEKMDFVIEKYKCSRGHYSVTIY